MFGGFDDIFRNMDRVMNNMMVGMMGNMQGRMPVAADPFSMMNNMIMPQMGPMGMSRQMSNLMMPNQPSSYSFSSQTISYSSNGQGRPVIREQTHSSVCGPNGIRETRETLRDSRTGEQRMAIGRHIRDRGHVMKKKRNVYTGEAEEADDYINLEEDEAPQFHEEFNRKVAGNGGRRSDQAVRNGRAQLAIAAPTTSGPEIVEISSEPLPSTSVSTGYVDEEDGHKIRSKKMKKEKKPYSKTA